MGGRQKAGGRPIDIPERLIDAVKNARHVMVLTGAGVSAESGLATFREKQVGLWERFDPLQLATLDAFRHDPALSWGWYEWRRMQVMQASPNRGHLAITRMSELARKLTLVTQNVDDLHERAGSSPVHHLHGLLAKPFCLRCKQPHLLPDAIPDEPINGRRVQPPRCTGCGGLVRPGVVWFGEPLPRREWQVAEQTSRDCDVFLCVGTSSTVFPAASLSRIAALSGAMTAQINPAGTEADDVTFNLRGPSGSILPEIVRRAWPPGLSL